MSAATAPPIHRSPAKTGQASLVRNGFAISSHTPLHEILTVDYPHGGQAADLNGSDFRNPCYQRNPRFNLPVTGKIRKRKPSQQLSSSSNGTVGSTTILRRSDLVVTSQRESFSSSSRVRSTRISAPASTRNG